MKDEYKCKSCLNMWLNLNVLHQVCNAILHDIKKKTHHCSKMKIDNLFKQKAGFYQNTSIKLLTNWLVTSL